MDISFQQCTQGTHLKCTTSTTAPEYECEFFITLLIPTRIIPQLDIKELMVPISPGQGEIAPAIAFLFDQQALVDIQLTR